MKKLSSDTRIDIGQGDSLTGMISSESFSGLYVKVQRLAIENVRAVKELESGIMGKLLGTRLPNMAVYSSFILSVAFLILIWVCLSAYICGDISGEFVLEVIKIVIPVITMSLGYMFGKKDSQQL